MDFWSICTEILSGMPVNLTSLKLITGYTLPFVLMSAAIIVFI